MSPKSPKITIFQVRPEIWPNTYFSPKSIFLFKFFDNSNVLIMCNILVMCNLHMISKMPIFAGSLESANSSILAARRYFKEVVGKKIRIL